MALMIHSTGRAKNYFTQRQKEKKNQFPGIIINLFQALISCYKFH